MFTALLEGLIAEAARLGKTDLSLVSMDATTARAHHDAAGMQIDPEAMVPLAEAVREAGEGPAKRGGPGDRTSQATPNRKNGDTSDADAGPA